MKKVELLKKRNVVNMYKNIIRVPYCELQTLLRFKTRMGYTSGVYGWNADIYQLNWNTVIVTGYRPFGNIENYEIYEKYEKLAQNLFKNATNYEKLENSLNLLIEEMLKELEVM